MMSNAENLSNTPSIRKQKYSIVAAGFGQNMLLVFVSTFLLMYLVEYAGISTQGMAIVTAIMTAAKIFDAFNDPLMGVMVDKTRTKMGKMRPYILVSALPVAFFTIMLFCLPNVAESGKLLFFGIMYFVWGVFYTVCDVPYWGLIGATFVEEKERVNVISLVRTAGTIAIALITLCSPWIAKALSFAEKTTSMGWTLAAILVSLFGMGLFVLAFFNTRERKSALDSPPITLKLIVTTLVKNRPLLLVLLGSIVGFGRYIVQTGGAVFAVVAYSDEGLFTLIGAAIILGLLLSVIGTQFLLRKFDDKILMIVSSLFGSLAYVIMFLLGFNNIYVVCAMIFLTGLSLGSFTILQTTMLFNSVDNIEKRTGVRNDGISFSMLTFVSKLMGTLAMLAFGIGVVASKYESGVVVTETMQSIVWFTITIVPAVSCLLSAIPFFFYKLPPVQDNPSTDTSDKQ